MERICIEEDSAPTGYRHFVVWAVIGLVLSFVAGPIEPTGAGGSAANVDAARIEGADQDSAN
jgi:hypothetical protein